MEYRKTHERRQQLKAKLEQLTATSKRRRKRRIADTGNARDYNREKYHRRLKRLTKRYMSLRDQIATLAYLVAENYWPKFFRKGQQLSEGSSSVSCPETERDDCIQAAVLKIVCCAQNFDHERGSLFAYLTEVCKNEFLGHIRKVQQRAVNHLRLLDTLDAETFELPDEIIEEAVAVISPDWSSRRPIAQFASYGGGDDVTTIAFGFKKAKPRRCDVPSLAKIVARRHATNVA